MPLRISDQQALDRLERLHLDPDYDAYASLRYLDRCSTCGSIGVHFGTVESGWPLRRAKGSVNEHISTSAKY